MGRWRLWLFAYYVSDIWAALLGLIWIVGRVVFCGALLVGALIGIVTSLVHGG